MKPRRHLGLLYGVLVLLIVSIGVWWFVFLTREGQRYKEYRVSHMEADRAVAAHLIQAVPEVGADPYGTFGEMYPHLVFRENQGVMEVSITQSVLDNIEREARRRQRMFAAEGVFFLALLAVGVTILSLAYRREHEFMRARELFLAGATHEFKTPLASLRLYTETLGRPTIDGDEADRIRGCMLDDVQRLESLIDQILALGHDERMARDAAEVLDLGEEIQKILSEMDDYITAHGGQLELDLPPGHLLRAPRHAISLAVRNLVTNAVVHSAPPSRIGVALSRQGRWLRLAVRDSGPGIPRSLRKKIFRSFTRGGSTGGADRKRTGTGLGLYIVKRQTEMMGGRVELAVREGAGSTFILVLPAHDEGRK